MVSGDLTYLLHEDSVFMYSIFVGGEYTNDTQVAKFISFIENSSHLMFVDAFNIINTVMFIWSYQ